MANIFEHFPSHDYESHAEEIKLSVTRTEESQEKSADSRSAEDMHRDIEPTMVPVKEHVERIEMQHKKERGKDKRYIERFSMHVVIR